MPYARFDSTAKDERPKPNALLTLTTQVDDAWIDYNAHMTEWQYYKVFADAGENFLRAAGFTEEYRLQGHSFFSVVGHMRNLRECRVGTPLQVFTEMIGYDAVRLHIYQYAIDTERDLVLATGEHLMLHVDTNQRKRVAMSAAMGACLARAMRDWGSKVRPKGLGEAIALLSDRD